MSAILNKSKIELETVVSDQIDNKYIHSVVFVIHYLDIKGRTLIGML